MDKFIRCHECGKKINYGESFYSADYPDVGDVFCSIMCFANFFGLDKKRPDDDGYDDDECIHWTNSEEEARELEEYRRQCAELDDQTRATIKKIAENGGQK